MALNLYQVQCFVAIAEERHFGRAAARMHITQPPLSRRLVLLEAQLGVRLINRNSRDVQLTRAGTVFLQEARQLLRMADEAAASSRLAAQGELGHLAIGFTAASAFELLPYLIRSYHQLHPYIGFTLKEMVTFTQAEQLAERKLDVGLVRPSLDLHRFESMLLDVDRLVVAIPALHPLAIKPTIKLEDLHRQPFIAHSPTESKYFHDITGEMFRQKHVMPTIVQSLAQPHTMLSMVRAGLGVALIANLATRHSSTDHIVFKNLEDGSPPIELSLIWHKKNQNPAVQDLLHIASELKNLRSNMTSAKGQEHPW